MGNNMSRNSRQYSSMRFQSLSRKDCFEGRYFKQVSHDEKTVICFIPVVSVHNGNSNPFSQIILAQRSGDVWQQTTDWLDVFALRENDEPFSLHLGDNSFRRDGLSIVYRGDRLQVKGKFCLHNLTAPCPVHLGHQLLWALFPTCRAWSASTA